MSFHNEWAWYNIYYPNPDDAICRLTMEESEWQRMTRWRDIDWFRKGGLETGKILLHNRKSLQPAFYADCSMPHLLPSAGITSACHACRHPSFYYDLYLSMLQERDDLISRGLIPPDWCDRPSPSAYRNRKPQDEKQALTMLQRKERERKACIQAIHGMEKDGWFEGEHGRIC